MGGEQEFGVGIEHNIIALYFFVVVLHLRDSLGHVLLSTSFCGEIRPDLLCIRNVDGS